MEKGHLTARRGAVFRLEPRQGRALCWVCWCKTCPFWFLPLEVEVRWAGGFFLHLEGNVSVNSGLDFCCSLGFVVPPLVGCLFFPSPTRRAAADIPKERLKPRPGCDVTCSSAVLRSSSSSALPFVRSYTS